MIYEEEFGRKMTVAEMKKDILSIVGEKCDWINLDDAPEEEDRNKYRPYLSKDELDGEINWSLKWQKEKFGLDVGQDTIFEKKVLFDAPNSDLYVVVYSGEGLVDFIVQIILSSDGAFDAFKITSRNSKDYYGLILEKVIFLTN